jgi:UDP-glucose 4-epimerase
MRVIIVRPPLVYGPDAIGNFKHLVKAVQLGIPLPLSSINNRRAFISVQNLVSFISKSLSFATTKFEIYLVADSEQISTPELVRRIAKAMDERECLFPMPIKALEFLLRAMGRPEARESLIGSMEVDISHAMSTGWKPEYSMDEGLKMALTTFGRDHV